MKKWIGILLFVLYAGFFALIAGPAAAAIIEITPTYGTAVIDGNISDWNLATDKKIPMHAAGKPDFPIESYAYLRYDYTHQIMNVLVLQIGYTGSGDIPYLLNSNYGVGNAWATLAVLNPNNNRYQDVKQYNDNSTNTYPPNSTLPNLAWVPVSQPAAGVIHSVGYEAAFALPLSSLNSSNDTTKFVVHVEWDSTLGGDPTGNTSGTEGFAVGAANTIVLHIPSTTSPVPLPASVLLLGSGLMGMGLIGWRRRERS